MNEIPCNHGGWYVADNIAIIIVGRDADIFFIGISIFHNGFAAQCPFVPVAEGILYNFLSEAKYMGQGVVADVSPSIESWKRNNAGHKTYFEINIRDILNTLLSVSNTDLNLLSKNIVLPICFPGIAGKQRDDTIKFIDIKMGKLGGTRINGEFN